MSLWRRPTPEQRLAFADFVDEHGPAMAALCKGLTRTAADAEDLLQESLAKVLERWDRVSAADEPYLYARRVVVNTSTSSWRRSHREQHVAPAEQVITAAGRRGDPLWAAHGQRAGVDVVGDRLEVLSLLRGLPERQRAVVVLRYLEDLPDDQIANLLQISASTVRSTALRGLRGLQALSAAGRPG